MSSPHQSPDTSLLSSVSTLMTPSFAEDHPSSEISNYAKETHRSAAALTFRARSRAQVRALNREVEALRAQIQSERTALAIQRASAEHARRAAHCARECIDSLLHHTLQPCFTLDREGLVTRWNSALAHSTGVSSADALGRRIDEIVSPSFSEPICSVLIRGTHVEPLGTPCTPQTLPGPLDAMEGLTAQSVTLLSLYHIPDCPEALIVLLTPSRPQIDPASALPGP